MNFEDTKYVKGKGGPGKIAEPNPYTDVVASIAFKKDKDGDPLAKSFILEHPADEDANIKAIAKVKRLFSKAGEANVPPVTVNSVASPVKVPAKGFKNIDENNPKSWTESDTQTRITFWTGPRVKRTRKPKDTTTGTVATASTPETVAVTNPS
jgi:hypothetical protein